MSAETTKPAGPKGDVGKLPRWAQDYIKDLEREREVAVRELIAFTERTAPAPVFIESMPCLGLEEGPTYLRKYINTNRVGFEWSGVRLEVSMHKGDDRSGCLRLSWGTVSDRDRDAVVFQPRSFNQVDLFLPKTVK